VKPHNFDSYRNKYESITLTRSDDGILEVRLHAPGDPNSHITYGNQPYGWTHPHCEWSYCFNDIARDYENEVVIITGTGDIFVDKHVGADINMVGTVPPLDPKDADPIFMNSMMVHDNLMRIPVPVIGAVNGPAHTHAEVAVMSDIVICSDTALFADQPHFPSGIFMPGDSVAMVWPLLLGENRGREFLLTGREISAAEALQLGVVSEVLPRARLMPRAYELARELLRRPKLVRRYTRQLFMHKWQTEMQGHLGYGQALEWLAAAGRVVK